MKTENATNTPRALSEVARRNFCVNMANLLPFLLLAATGLVLQSEYHLHRLPCCTPVLGLQKGGWLLLHKLFAVVSLAGCTLHCLLHRRWIAAAFRRRMQRRTVPSRITRYLLVVSIPTALTALVSWFFLGPGHGRFMLVEIHDKLALVLTILFLLHLATRTGWMVQTMAALRRPRPPV
ncbi:MAG: DUF4405 domain-containing protein [Spirochaetes bacterium]|nr:DUF4405 domain-containing protein [Spirochaetota bacterium]